MEQVSRRGFLAAGLALPAAGFHAASDASLPPQGSPARPEPVPLTYRTLGRTGLKVTSLAFGCMTTSDPSVITRAADLGINLFDTARVYQNGNNERMVGAALKDLAKLGQTDVVLTTYNFAMRSVDAGQNANPDAPKTDMAEAIRSARKAGPLPSGAPMAWRSGRR